MIAIGDIHGKVIWEDILEKENPDKVIFIGDYFDCFEKITTAEQIYNFQNICNLKKENHDKYTILLGNHDMHYIIDGQCSGYQKSGAFDIGKTIKQAIKDNIVLMCHEIKIPRIIFSHAGISKTWCKANNIDINNLENSVNEKLISKPNVFKFTPGKQLNPYGDEICQGPTWIRPNSLMKDKIDGVHVIGHTAHRDISIGEIINIDCLDYSSQYLEIKNGEFKVKTL